MPLLDAATLIAALDLPSGCRVDQRVPKKLLVENGAPTTADKRKINDGIEEIYWLAALKPTTIGVPEYRDEAREYLEIAVLTVTLRPGAKIGRLAELTHRAVPYPVFLIMIAASTNELTLSLAHKRWAQNEAGKVVLEGDAVVLNFSDASYSAVAIEAFMPALSLARQPLNSLFTLYQGWVDNMQALLAARLTGTFSTASDSQQASLRRQYLGDYERLELESNRLRLQAAKEKQMARQVSLNLELRRILKDMEFVKQQITSFGK